MRLGKFCRLIISGTVLSVVYIHMQMQIIDLAYQGIHNEKKINDIVFDEDGSILADIGLPGVLGLGLTTFNTATGQIIDITIIINGSIPSSAAADLLATVIHEMGHTWGFAHIPIGGINTTNSVSGFDRISPAGIPTMYPFAIPQDDRFGRSLESDDHGSALLLYGP